MSDENEQFEIPDPLADALRDAYTHRLEIPRTVDNAVMSIAHAEFGRRRRMRLMARWGTGLAAGLAAIVVLAISLHRPAPVKSVAKGDVNGDGTVNIVDALSLARHLANHDTIEKGWDLNGDGVVDQKDVDAVAMGAVSLKGAGVASNSLPKLHELGIDRRVPCPPGLSNDVVFGKTVFGSGGHVLALAKLFRTADMPTPAGDVDRQSQRGLAAGEGMAPDAAHAEEELR